MMNSGENTALTMPVVPYQSGGAGGLWGNDWMSFLVLFLIVGMFGFGGMGFGGGWGGNGGVNGAGFQGIATRADINEGFALNGLQNGQTSIRDAVTGGFHGVDNAVCTLGYQTQAGLNALGQQLASCCCETREAIQGVRYDVATQASATQNVIQNGTRDIIENQNANARAVLDAMAAQRLEAKNERIAELNQQVFQLQLAASQQAQNAYITANQQAQTAELIRRLGKDCPVPAYVVPNPNCCYGTPVGVMNNGCLGCNA